MPERGREHAKYFMWEHKGQSAAVLYVGVAHPDGQGLMAAARNGPKVTDIGPEFKLKLYNLLYSSVGQSGSKNLDVTPGDGILL